MCHKTALLICSPLVAALAVGCAGLAPGIDGAYRLDDPPALSPYAQSTNRPLTPQPSLGPAESSRPERLPQSPPADPLPAEPPSPLADALDGPSLSGPIIIPQQVTVPAHFEVGVKAPDQIQVGSGATFAVTIRNAGDDPLENVTIESSFDDSLIFPGADEKRVRQTLGRLAPHDMKDLPLTLVSNRLGRHCVRFEISADNAPSVTRQACVEFVARQVEVLIDGPDTAVAGERAQFQIRVVNQGPQPLNNLQILVLHDGAVVPREGSAGAVQRARSLSWTIRSLRPGEGVPLQLAVDCRAVARQSCLAVSVDGETVPTEETEAFLTIVPRGVGVGGVGPVGE